MILFRSFLTSFYAAMILPGLLVSCASMGSGGHAAAGGYDIVEDGVIFKYVDPDAQKVNLIGDFNNWMPAADPMNDKNGDGEWTLFYPLTPGRYEYKFVIDGRHWIPDPRNPLTVSDGFNGENSVVVIPLR